MGRNGRTAPLARLADEKPLLWRLVHQAGRLDGVNPGTSPSAQLAAAALLGDYNDDELALIALGEDVR